MTFEGEFDTEVQALFAETDFDSGVKKNQQGKMLLITRYKDLSVWQASDNPQQKQKKILCADIS